MNKKDKILTDSEKKEKQKLGLNLRKYKISQNNSSIENLKWLDGVVSDLENTKTQDNTLKTNDKKDGLFGSFKQKLSKKRESFRGTSFLGYRGAQKSNSSLPSQGSTFMDMIH